MDWRDLKAERDRFVAFAFAAADVLIETDRAGNVLFCTGAISRLKAAAPDAVARRLSDFFHDDDAPIVEQYCEGLLTRKRLEPIHLRAETKRGRYIKVKLGGCLLETQPDRLFFTFSFTLSPAGESDHRFVSAATERYREALESGLDPKLSVLVLEGLNKLVGSRDPAEVQDFLTRLRAVVRAYTLGGEAAEVFDDETMALVHTADLADGALDQAVNDLAVKVFDEPLKVQTFTIDMRQGALSSGDEARALTYAVRQLTRTNDPNRTVISLQECCQSIIADAMDRVAELRGAIDQRDFTLVYQPIVDVTQNKVHHFEALSRFTSDRPTQELIQMAEQSGLVEDLDLVVLDMVIEALRKAAQSGWQPCLAANISARTIESDIYKDAVLKAIKGAADVAAQLMVELTETVTIEDFGLLGEHLKAVQMTGCRVCIDDVGAGTTSFETVISLPADFMKLDGQLLNRARDDEQARQAVAAIVEMCRARDVPIIAEHIENEETLALARRFGIGLGQGFHYGRPIADPQSFTMPSGDDDGKSLTGRYARKKGGRETWG